MDIDEANTLAYELLREHRLAGWRVVFDRARTRAGICRYGSREIGLSTVLTALHSAELVRGTILHEIAHALVGPRHGHDGVWRATARAIGSDGERCLSPSAPRPPAPWVGTCVRGHEVTRHRRPTRPASCSRCSATFDAAHLLLWTFHGRRVALSSEHLAELAMAGGGAMRPPTRPGRGLLTVGTEVVLSGSGKYAGLSGKIVKRGRSRYHVRTRGVTVTAPFALVQPAPRAHGRPSAERLDEAYRPFITKGDRHGGERD